ncbi:LapA family protein [Conexibacter arvalis]|uniref:Putative integral membrane protein n=1 Tax=Conexibacter arvalis TaxID=912552 RepID=A0A840I7P4_9ACTN|nr:LapA family protein [Conexibacter arvalis]MBB4660909.1 putative integral membrane protein [Conexibacter arvalis]
MSDSPTHGHGGAPAESKRDRNRTIAVGILATLAAVFAVANLDEVKVSFLFGSVHMPLIIVIVGCLLIGAAIGAFLTRRGSKRG